MYDEIWWTKAESGHVSYVATDDGEFERIMEKWEPHFFEFSYGGHINLARAIWEHARTYFVRKEADDVT